MNMRVVQQSNDSVQTIERIDSKFMKLMGSIEDSLQQDISAKFGEIEKLEQKTIEIGKIQNQLDGKLSNVVRKIFNVECFVMVTKMLHLIQSRHLELNFMNTFDMASKQRQEISVCARCISLFESHFSGRLPVEMGIPRLFVMSVAQCKNLIIALQDLREHVESVTADMSSIEIHNRNLSLRTDKILSDISLGFADSQNNMENALRDTKLELGKNITANSDKIELLAEDQQQEVKIHQDALISLV